MLNLGASGLSPAVFQTAGSCTISGDIKASQSVLVTDGTGSNASLTSGGGFTNNGTLTLETTGGNHDISLNVLSGTLVNAGILYVNTGTGGNRTINASLTNNGTVVFNSDTVLNKPLADYVNNGRTNLRNASIAFADGSSVLINGTNGVVFGSGTINIPGGVFYNNGLVQPGYHVGTLNVTGDYEQSSTGTTEVQIAGLLADTEHDVIGVSDSVTLAGTLNVSTIFDFAPSIGDTFRIVTSGILTGTFETINLPIISDVLGWDVSYEGNAVTLSVVYAAVPDVNSGPDAAIDEGSTFSGSGSFEDPGDDTWTATVDYGDGSGVQPLALDPDKTFSLGHLYTDEGTYPVTITVTDEDGGVGTDTITVTVTPVEPTVILVEIDVKPGNSANKIHFGKKGAIWVAVLTDEDFDAASIDTGTVTFGPGGASPERYRFKDADHDGDIDLLFRFKVSKTGLQINDTSVVLRGMTTDGQDFEGTDSVEIIPKKEKKKTTDKGKYGPAHDKAKGKGKGKK